MTVAVNEMKKGLSNETLERVKEFYLTVGSLYDLVLNVDNFLENDREKHSQFTKKLTNTSRTYEKCLALYKEYENVFEEPEKAKKIIDKLGQYEDVLSLDPKAMDKETYKGMYATTWVGFLQTSKIPVRQYL